ncbi:L-asparaginase [Rubellimicrobium mesophilum DSM 19309]|uniref:L-asparaginase n=1 Tax=Rubellimicrobium mesophilum DSM 19309 TaxID=442562 RepID=A0A017HLT9_9RHOB|nr:asparaginase domain-containing protein [Rubellimicrobium mesophilum]EYD75326.1 L-asparaginase [Rubellimicrobium mesophilum DSM 19309]
MLALGGTIAMTDAGQQGVVPTLTGEMLVAAVPALRDVADVDAQSFRQVPGAHLGFADLEALALAIEDAVAGGTRGVVVTQGTDTIEETAFALDRLLEVDAPVVVTGAMRNPDPSRSGRTSKPARSGAGRRKRGRARPWLPGRDE